jgi:hypothetical protein
MLNPKFSAELVAPCGMNCAICKAYLSYSRGVPKKKGQISHCSGCRERNKKCAFIKRDCEKICKQQISSCSQCKGMPCASLAHLDEHYSQRYGMSMVENLKMIQEKGMDAFLSSQEEKYRCPSCGDVISVHDGKCYSCGFQDQKPKQKIGKAQWDKARWIPDRKKEK